MLHHYRAFYRQPRTRIRIAAIPKESEDELALSDDEVTGPFDGDTGSDDDWTPQNESNDAIDQKQDDGNEFSVEENGSSAPACPESRRQRGGKNTREVYQWKKKDLERGNQTILTRLLELRDAYLKPRMNPLSYFQLIWDDVFLGEVVFQSNL